MLREGHVEPAPLELPEVVPVADVLSVDLTGVQERGVLVQLFPGTCQIFRVLKNIDHLRVWVLQVQKRQGNTRFDKPPDKINRLIY